jgi:hypothetical protein
MSATDFSCWVSAASRADFNVFAVSMSSHAFSCWLLPLVSGRTMARIGLRMMPPFPSSRLRCRTAGCSQYGSKAGLSDRAFPGHAAVKLAPSIRSPGPQEGDCRDLTGSLLGIMSCKRC